MASDKVTLIDIIKLSIFNVSVCPCLCACVHMSMEYMHGSGVRGKIQSLCMLGKHLSTEPRGGMLSLKRPSYNFK